MTRGSKVFLVVLVVLVGGAFYAIDQLNAFLGEPAEESVTAGEPVTVEVPQGASASAIAEQLADVGVVESAQELRGELRGEEQATSIQAGTYGLETGMSAEDALAALLAGPQLPDAWRVTIPEGLTVDETLEQIANAEESPFTVEELAEALPEVELPDWVPAADELPEDANRYEGMLFPLTYDFADDATAEEVLARLVAQTDEVVGGLQTPLGGGPHNVLTVASLVEREARIAEERDDVAAVIYNRLEMPMRLQIDATVLYALGRTSGAPSFEELETDSPWNTYATDGLPPTPISGAGRAAVEAAVEPSDIDARFYVVCNIEEGRHVFAVTNDEHNENVARFRALRDGEIDPFCPGS